MGISQLRVIKFGCDRNGCKNNGTAEVKVVTGQERLLLPDGWVQFELHTRGYKTKGVMDKERHTALLCPDCKREILLVVDARAHTKQEIEEGAA